MIIKISDEQAIWFGYATGPKEKVITFEEGIYMMLKSQGYSKEEIHGLFNKPGGDMLISRMLKKGLPPVTKEQFVARVKTYLQAFKPAKFAHPDKAMIVNLESYAQYAQEAKGYANFIISYLATI